MYQIYDPASTDPRQWNLHPHAVPEQPDSAGAHRSRCEIDHRTTSSRCCNRMSPASSAGTSAYVRNNYISNGTHHRSQQQVQHQGRSGAHRQAANLVLLRAHPAGGLYGPTGAPGLPKPLAGNPGYNRSDVYRISHDYTISPTLLNRFYAGGNNWQQNHGSYSTYKDAPQAQGIPTTDKGWKEQGICIPNYPDCNLDFPAGQFLEQRVHQLGRGRAERLGQHRRRVPGRHDEGHGPPHIQVGLLLQQHPLQRLRVAEHRRQRHLPGD